MQTYFVTIPDLDLVDVKVKARTPQSAALRVLKQSAKDGSDLDFQDGAEAIIRSRQKKIIFEITSTHPFHLEMVG